MVTTLFESSLIPIYLLILSISCVVLVHLWCSLSFVSPSAFSVALNFALASQFTSNCEPQQLSHNWHFQGNTGGGVNSRGLKVSLHLIFGSSSKMTLWYQLIGWLPSGSLEEVTLGNLRFLTVAEQKLLGRKTDDQVAEESSAPEFIMYVQGWLDNFQKWQLEIGKHRYRNSGIRWKIGYSHFILRFSVGSKIKRKNQTTYPIHPALEFALASQFTPDYESQKLSHDWHFQGNTRNKMNSRESKISLHISFNSS